MLVFIQFLFNVTFKINIGKENIFELEDTKWALSIDSIKSITLYKKKPLEIKFIIDKNINKKIVEENKFKMKNKSERIFLLYNNEDYNKFVFEMRRLYLISKKSYLNIVYSQYLEKNHITYLYQIVLYNNIFNE